MTEKEKIDQMFAILERAQKVKGVGDLKSFQFSWDMTRSGTEAEMFPRLSVEYWAKPA